MPNISKIAPANRKQWLVDFDNGKAVIAIAKEAGRTSRTVQDHLARARQEREFHEVRYGLIRDAYRDHQKDLEEVLGQLRDQVLSADPNEPGPGDDTRTTLLLESLKTHVKNKKLWQAVDVAAKLHDRRETLEEHIREDIEAKVETAFEGAEISLEGVVESLKYLVTENAGGRDMSIIEYKTDNENGGTRLHWGYTTLTKGYVDDGKSEDVRVTHESMMKALIGSDSNWVTTYREVDQQLKDAKETIEMEVEAQLLRHLLPGRCNICPV
jgi:hypothetical protein